jgi:hypothetical protein
MVVRASFKKDARRYRYYMSKAVVTGNRKAAGEIKFIPAHVIEPLLLGHLTKDPTEHLDEAARAALFARIGRATLYADRITVEPEFAGEGGAVGLADADHVKVFETDWQQPEEEGEEERRTHDDECGLQEPTERGHDRRSQHLRCPRFTNAAPTRLCATESA